MNKKDKKKDHLQDERHQDGTILYNIQVLVIFILSDTFRYKTKSTIQYAFPLDLLGWDRVGRSS